MKWRQHFPFPRLLFALFCTVPLFGGTIVNLGFSSLPSAQGWGIQSNRFHGESTYFSVASNMLDQQTIVPFDSGYIFYTYPGIPDEPFILDVTAILIGSSVVSPPYPTGSGVMFSDRGFYVGITQGYIAADSGSTTVTTQTYALDTQSWHNYQMVVTDPDAGFDLYIDGTFAFSNAPRYYDYGSTYGPALVLGDLTSGNDAHAAYSRYFYATIPEPATASLVLLGGLGLFFLRRRAIG
jgi:hypothetical protein